MNRNLVLALGATVLTMAFFYFRDHKDKISVDRNSDLEIKTTYKSTHVVSQSIDNKNSNDLNLENTSSVSSLAHTADEKDTIDKNFIEHLKTIGTCLKINPVINHDRVEPTYDNFLVSIRPALGDLVVQMDDWTQLDLVSVDGVKKRIRTEVNYENPNNPVKYVQLYHINEDGMPEMQIVDPEKSVNPSEDYINYLKGGASVAIDERGSRAYFPDGEELVLVERSGKIESLSLTKNGKTVSCTSLDSLQSNCQCLE